MILTDSEFFRIVENGVIVNVRVTPGGSKDAVEGVITDDAGNSFVKARVTAQPEKGKANKSVLKLLAKEWGFPSSALEIISSEKSRNKKILIKGDKDKILTILRQWQA